MRKEISKTISFLQFNPGSGIGKLIESHVQNHLPAIKETIILDSVEAIMECVNQGIGFTLLSQADAERYGKPDTVILELEPGNPSRRLVLATPDRETARHFQDSLAELFN